MRWAWLLALSGCSLLGPQEPTTGPIDGPIDCRSALPYVDAMAASIAGTVAATVFIATVHDPFGGLARFLLGGPALIVTALAGSSAAYGFYNVHGCRAHVDDEVAWMQNEAREAARVGRCDDIVGARDRLEVLGRELDLRDPSTRACFPYYCATADSGFCTCSHEESECAAAVSAGLARACIPSRADVCTEDRSASTR
jgi:hypothetical protein